MSKYLSFLPVGSSESGKTKIVAIMNANQTCTLGHIRWYGPWRKYVACFAVTPPPIYDADCLDELARELRVMNAEHRQKKDGLPRTLED